jgi:hypothetical protein
MGWDSRTIVVTAKADAWRDTWQCLWDVEAERLRGLEVDDQLELDGLLHR